LGDDAEHAVARWEQLGSGVVGAELDLDQVVDRFGHAHQSVSLGALVGGERHVEHDALIDLAGQHLRLALAARAGTAVVREGVSGTLERAEHGVAGLRVDLAARRRESDGGRHVDLSCGIVTHPPREAPATRRTEGAVEAQRRPVETDSGPAPTQPPREAPATRRTEGAVEAQRRPVETDSSPAPTQPPREAPATRRTEGAVEAQRRPVETDSGPAPTQPPREAPATRRTEGAVEAQRRPVPTMI